MCFTNAALALLEILRHNGNCIEEVKIMLDLQSFKFLDDAEFISAEIASIVSRLKTANDVLPSGYLEVGYV